MGIKHTTQTAKANNPDYDVSADVWNEDHEIDGDVDFEHNEALKFRPENVDTLPSPTLAMLGRTVFLTTDNHLYVVRPTA